MAPNPSSHSSTEWFRAKHRPRALDDVKSEISRGYERRYIIRRPHPLQYRKDDSEFKANLHDVEHLAPVISDEITPVQSRALHSEKSKGEEDTVNLRELRLKQARVTEKHRRAQFDLFLDLVMVAFIANLAETFSEEAFDTENPERDIGGAFLTYSMSFILVSRIWKDLRLFMNRFFVDDYLQRALIIAILAVVIVLASTAPALDVLSPGFGATLDAMITSYTIVRAMFGIIYFYYALMLPWLRKIHLSVALLSLPSIALWIGTIYTEMPGKIVIFFVTVAVETALQLIPSTPLYSKLTQGYQLQKDWEHYLERMSAFLTILLGSGIEILVSSSPAGHKLDPVLRYVVPAFLVIYFLYYMYTNGAEDPVYLHAVRRSWRCDLLWELLHIPLFGSVPVLGVALAALTSLTYGDLEDPNVIDSLRAAQWISSSCFSLIIATMTFISLLNKPVEAPYKLMIDNRYLRILARFMIVIIAPCLPLALEPQYHIGTLAGLISAVSIWEFFASWNRDGKFFEPKHVEKTEEQAEPQPEAAKVVTPSGVNPPE